MNFIMILLTALLFIGCSGETGQQENTESFMEGQQQKKTYGKIQHVDVGTSIDATMASAGKEVFDVKCTACHKYVDFIQVRFRVYAFNKFWPNLGLMRV